MSYRKNYGDIVRSRISGVWAGICGQSGQARHVYHGRCSAVFCPGRGSPLQPVRDKCRASDRPCLGWEPCTIDLIKAYVPQSRSFSSGQVLSGPCGYEQTRIIVREMADAAAISLFEKRMLTDQVVLTLCYDTENLSDPEILKKYTGSVKKDRYGRRVPKDAHGTENIRRPTSSSDRSSMQCWLSMTGSQICPEDPQDLSRYLPCLDDTSDL